MTPQVGHLDLAAAPPAAPVVPVGPATHRTPAPDIPALKREADSVDVISATPPLDVLEQVAAAFETAQQMYADNRELHFQKDPTSGRIVVEVRDLKGNVLKTIPPSEALDMMSGPIRK